MMDNLMESTVCISLYSPMNCIFWYGLCGSDNQHGGLQSDRMVAVNGKDLVTMRRRMPPNLGLKVLAVWLIVSGLISLINLQFAGLNLVMGALAIAAGILIVMER